MAIYSVGRKRVILALLLTTALLLTLDLRGNAVIDAGREAFAQVMRPVETATGVVTNPIERFWNGISNYDDLEQENLALQEQVDRLSGTQAAAEAAVIEGKNCRRSTASRRCRASTPRWLASSARPRTISIR